MTDQQREECNRLMEHIREAGLFVSLHQFRSVDGYRVVAGDGGRHRFQRDGEDPALLLREITKLVGLPRADTQPSAVPNPEPADPEAGRSPE